MIFPMTTFQEVILSRGLIAKEIVFGNFLKIKKSGPKVGKMMKLL